MTKSVSRFYEKDELLYCKAHDTTVRCRASISLHHPDDPQANHIDHARGHLDVIPSRAASQPCQVGPHLARTP